MVLRLCGVPYPEDCKTSHFLAYSLRMCMILIEAKSTLIFPYQERLIAYFILPHKGAFNAILWIVRDGQKISSDKALALCYNDKHLESRGQKMAKKAKKFPSDKAAQGRRPKEGGPIFQKEVQAELGLHALCLAGSQACPAE